ncbi:MULTISPECIES: hypothetical protein [Streptomyces]|uniref:Transposase n=1 Tax=Streptomyces doebereineriae TaxID=3075528 RepID=A0ABU2VPL9_9ACTN|nr:hypothetical protein [Streptomyces sp. DSM 41640]MDT0487259.1 hypothetical protein [Streptomyces sp. DSM 41640]
MDPTATGEPVIVQEDTQLRVGIDLRSAGGQVLGQGPDGKSVGLTVDLVNDACDGPELAFPPRSGGSRPSPRPTPETSASPNARDRRPNGVLEPFKAYLDARFTETQGQVSGTRLFQEIHERGYRGSRQVVPC